MQVLAATLRRLAKIFQTLRHFFSIFPTIESRDSKVAFALRAETATGRDDHVYITKHTIEHLPTRQAIRRFYPKVRRIHAAEYFQASLGQSFAQDFSVAHTTITTRPNLLSASR